MKRLTEILFGGILVACGVIYILEVLGIASIQFSLDGWWTLFIILPCIDGLIKNKDKSGYLVGLLIGVLLLLAARGVLPYAVAAPVAVVAVGIKIIVKALMPQNKKEE